MLDASTDLLMTPDARVRVLALHSGQAGRWHRHAALVEHVVALDPGILVEFAAGDVRRLAPAEIVEVGSGRVHRVSNAGGSAARYLLVQRGPYDFIDAPAPAG
jgi:quercetin dioxygenase-like cupin family protein